MHLGPCLEESPTYHYDHPWCGTPMLVTHPINQMIISMFEIGGWIFVNETLCCCHNYLSTLCNAILVGVQHRVINIEHVMWVVAIDDEYYCVIIGWGYVVLQERDNPCIFPKFSSTFTLQEKRLCLTSSAEGLVYPFFLVCGRISVLPIWVLIEFVSKDKNIIKMSICE